MPAHARAALHTFRTDLHRCFHRRADALFERGDALLAATSVVSLPHLCLQAAHRRGWGSLYDALAAGRIDGVDLRALLLEQAISEGQPDYAIDLSVWPRCDAEASPERGFYYHPARHSAGQPSVAGWAHQWLARLSFARASWSAPLCARRVHPSQNANAIAVEQITALLSRLPPESAPPLFVFDAGYDLAQVTQGVRESPVAVRVRLRADRCFYADPPPAKLSPKGGHGCTAPSLLTRNTGQRAKTVWALSRTTAGESLRARSPFPSPEKAT